MKNFMVLNMDPEAHKRLLEQDVTIDLARSCVQQRKRSPVIRPEIRELVVRKPEPVHQESVITIRDSIRESKSITAAETPNVQIPRISDSVIKVRYAKSWKQKLRAASMFNQAMRPQTAEPSFIVQRDESSEERVYGLSPKTAKPEPQAKRIKMKSALIGNSGSKHNTEKLQPPGKTFYSNISIEKKGRRRITSLIPELTCQTIKKSEYNTTSQKSAKEIRRPLEALKPLKQAETALHEYSLLVFPVYQDKQGGYKINDFQVLSESTHRIIPGDTQSKDSNNFEVYKDSEQYRIAALAPLLFNYPPRHDQLVFGSTEVQKGDLTSSKELNMDPAVDHAKEIQLNKFGGSLYKLGKTIDSAVEDISAPKVMQVKRRKHKTISTVNVAKILEDKKARLNRRMFKSTQGV